MSSVQVHSVGDEMTGRARVTLECDGRKRVVEGDGFVCAVDDTSTDMVAKAAYGSGESIICTLLELIEDVVNTVDEESRSNFFTLLFEHICTEEDYTNALAEIERKRK